MGGAGSGHHLSERGFALSLLGVSRLYMLINRSVLP